MPTLVANTGRSAPLNINGQVHHRPHWLPLPSPVLQSSNQSSLVLSAAAPRSTPTTPASPTSPSPPRPHHATDAPVCTSPPSPSPPPPNPRRFRPRRLGRRQPPTRRRPAPPRACRQAASVNSARPHELGPSPLRAPTSPRCPHPRARLLLPSPPPKSRRRTLSSSRPAHVARSATAPTRQSGRQALPRLPLLHAPAAARRRPADPDHPRARLHHPGVHHDVDIPFLPPVVAVDLPTAGDKPWPSLLRSPPACSLYVCVNA